MKMLKKFNSIFLIILLLYCSFFVAPTKASAKTFRQVKDEYQKTVDQYNANKQKEKLTQEQINTIRNNIVLIQRNIEKGQQDIITLNKEIDELERKMDEKDVEIKRILNFLQLSEGENVYLEYAFGAKSFTDFIYRMAVTEQLANYNDKLIKEYNEMVEANKKRKEEIAAKEVEMKKQQSSLGVELSKMQTQLSEIYEDSISLDDALKSQKEMIDIYENVYHCNLDDNIDSCAPNALPVDTSFWRPVQSGAISSEYGMRWHPTKEIYTLHTGVDIAASMYTPVYAVAAGQVVDIWYHYSCGGNMIFIQHRVNGQYYTSIYMHLYSVNVSRNDVVTKDTVIGASGGDERITTWDSCTKGAHLHLSMMNGRYGLDFGGVPGNFSRNPRELINFPSGGNWFSNRTTKY